MATITTTEEALKKSAELQELKEKEMETRARKQDEKKRQSKCAAVGKIGKVGIVLALGLLGHTIKQNEKLQRDLTPPHSSIETAVLTNMTDELATLRKQNEELHKAQDTLNKLIENNPTKSTQPYAKEVWLHKEIAKAKGEEVEKEEDTSKAVVKSKGRKKGGYFNEHFNLTF